MDLGMRGAGALVTGASGGIGAAIALALHREGVRVAVHAHRNRAAAEALAAELGGPVVQGDLREEADADRIVAEAVAELGPLSLCVANAGVWPHTDTPVAQMSLARWQETVAGNLTVAFLTSRAWLRQLPSDAAGALVLVASTAGLMGEEGHADYAASKAAIAHGLALSLKNEIVRRSPRSRVNVVAPGWTATPMTASELDDSLTERVTATMALRNVAQAEDIARGVAWLCSPVAAGHVTGQILTIAGGMEGRLLWPDSAPSSGVVR